MQIKDIVLAYHQFILDHVSDSTCWACDGVAWKTPVEVPTIIRRTTACIMNCRAVGQWQDRYLTFDSLWLELTDQLCEGQLALVFITMNPGHQKNCRSIAVLYVTHGQLDAVERRPVNRIGQFYLADMFTIMIKWDCKMSASMHILSYVGAAMNGDLTPNKNRFFE